MRSRCIVSGRTDWRAGPPGCGYRRRRRAVGRCSTLSGGSPCPSSLTSRVRSSSTSSRATVTTSSSPDQRVEFERHLSVCPSCVAYLKTYERTIALTRATGDSLQRTSPSRSSRQSSTQGKPDLGPELGRRNGARVVQILLDARRIRRLLAALERATSHTTACRLARAPHTDRHGVSRRNVRRESLDAPVARLVSSRQARSCMRLPAAPLAARPTHRRSRSRTSELKGRTDSVRWPVQPDARTWVRSLDSRRDEEGPRPDRRRLTYRGLVGHRAFHGVLRFTRGGNRDERRAIAAGGTP